MRIKSIAAGLLAAILFLTPVSAGVKGFSDQQVQCLKNAYVVGNQIKFNGQPWGETYAALVYRESELNKPEHRKVKGVPLTQQSIGAAQVKVVAARAVQKVRPYVFFVKYGKKNPSNIQLASDLLNDEYFNLRVGAAYFEMCIDKHGDIRKALRAYNKGINTKSGNYAYADSVVEKRKNIVSPYLAMNNFFKEKGTN